MLLRKHLYSNHLNTFLSSDPASVIKLNLCLQLPSTNFCPLSSAAVWVPSDSGGNIERAESLSQGGLQLLQR